MRVVFYEPHRAASAVRVFATGISGHAHYDVDAGRVKIPAAWMIDRCGWKGKALGPAAVHGRQALVLVNSGGATGADIVALSDAVRASVREKFGIDIHPEVCLINSKRVLTHPNIVVYNLILEIYLI